MVKIGGLQKTTLIDFPGKIACAVFLIGCNFRCPWCYNPELVLPDKFNPYIKKNSGGVEKDFFNFLKERKELLEAITICGGEPCINQDLPQFCKKIKKLGYLVKLDTNGSNPKMLKYLIDKKLVDYVAMDIKAPIKAKSEKRKAKNNKLKFKNKYEQTTGVKVNLRDIKKSIEIIKNSGIDYEFRSTIIPLIHTKEDVIQMAKDISPARTYYLQNFRPEKTIDSKFEKIKPYSDEKLLEIQKAIAPFFEICRIR